MSDLKAREPDVGAWDMPVVELVEDGRVVGIAYLDDIEVFAEFHPDEDGEAWTFDLGDLQRVLDTAHAMLSPEGTEAVVGATVDLGGEHPVDVLAGEFDGAAALRGPEDEGFYPLPVVRAMIERAAQLDLAVVSLEAVTVHDGWAEPVHGQAVDVGAAHDGEDWPVFKSGCNLLARTLLEKWPEREGSAVAVEVGDREGDRYVL